MGAYHPRAEGTEHHIGANTAQIKGENMNTKQRLDERLSIYFDLNKNQRRKLNSISSHISYDSDLSIEEFSNITSNKSLIERFKRLKYEQGLRLVVDNGDISERVIKSIDRFRDVIEDFRAS